MLAFFPVKLAAIRGFKQEKHMIQQVFSISRQYAEWVRVFKARCREIIIKVLGRVDKDEK